MSARYDARSPDGLYNGENPMNNLHALTSRFPQDGVELVSITKELTRFRQRLESESGKPIHELELNAAELLSDLVVHLQLGPRQHDEILGQPSIDYLSALLGARISLTLQQ